MAATRMQQAMNNDDGVQLKQYLNDDPTIVARGQTWPITMA
jgi:hypothetical protein